MKFFSFKYTFFVDDFKKISYRFKKRIVVERLDNGYFLLADKQRKCCLIFPP